MTHEEWFVHDTLAPETGPFDDDDIVVEFVGDRMYTKGELRGRALALAERLRVNGVRTGDRALIAMGNRVEFLDALFACSYLGVIALPVPTAFRGDTLDRAVARAEPTVLLADATMVDALSASSLVAATPLIVTCASEVLEALPRERSERWPSSSLASAPVPTVAHAASDPFCIYCSSGTTGAAKGVTLPHGAVRSMMRTSQIVLAFDRSDVVYTPMPLFHANAFIVMFLTACSAGARTVISGRFSASRYWREVADCGATKSSLMGSAASILLETSDGSPLSTDLRLIAAVPRPPDSQRFEAVFGTRLTEFYGSTEAGLPIGIPMAEHAPLKSCGRLLPDWSARIVDERGHAVQRGDVGELWVRPERAWTTSLGYWGDPVATVEMWRNQWVQTGDVMRQDDDGWFYYVDRKKDSIRVSGENVPSADVELAIVKFPDITDAAAFGVPSRLGEQDLMVCYVSTSDIDVDALLEHCRHQLPHFAVPRYFESVDALPVTPTGKVRKVALRERGVTASTIDVGRTRRRHGTNEGRDDL